MKIIDKKLIRLTESDLHKIVKESVNEILSKINDFNSLPFYKKVKCAKVGDEIYFKHFLDNHIVHHTIVKVENTDEPDILYPQMYWFYDRDGELTKIYGWEIEDIKRP